MACSRDHKNERVAITVAAVGDRTITRDDLLRRAELTIVPSFAATGPPERSQIILNNLITEKLLALEAGDENELARSEAFQLRMQGIKEQLMREALYYKQAYDRVELDSAEFKQVFEVAGREYEIEFFAIMNDSIAGNVTSVLATVPESLRAQAFDELRDYARPGKRTIAYKDPEDWAVHRALFSELLDAGEIVGPVRIERNSHVVMKVVDWKYYPAITAPEIGERTTRVKDKLTRSKAEVLAQGYMADIMKGKSIDFIGKTFKKVVDVYYGVYSSQQNGEGLSELARDEFNPNDETFLNEVVLSVDGEPWTVEQFRRAVISRPLMLGDQKLDRYDFQRHFRDRVVDLVRDHFLTKEAYKQGLDKHPFVAQQSQMWRDAFIALSHKSKVLSQLAGKNHPLTGPDLAAKFAGYVDSLQTKYGSRIKVNHEELRQIKLTNTPMYAWKPNVPFPAAVPPFPQLVNSGELGYAKKE